MISGAFALLLARFTLGRQIYAVGVLILGLLTNILQLSNVDGNIQLVLKGVIIVAAVRI